METLDLQFADNPAIKGREAGFAELRVDAAKVVQSWRQSLFAFEWLNPDGKVKSLSELPEREKAKRSDVEERLKRNAALDKPILGIGLYDNVEIGSGRAIFLTLVAQGIRIIPVHVPRGQLDEFSDFAA